MSSGCHLSFQALMRVSITGTFCAVSQQEFYHRCLLRINETLTSTKDQSQTQTPHHHKRFPHTAMQRHWQISDRDSSSSRRHTESGSPFTFRWCRSGASGARIHCDDEWQVNRAARGRRRARSLLNTPICSYPEALLYHLMQMRRNAGSASACEQTLFHELDQF